MIPASEGLYVVYSTGPADRIRGWDDGGEPLIMDDSGRSRLADSSDFTVVEVTPDPSCEWLVAPGEDLKEARRRHLTAGGTP